MIEGVEASRFNEILRVVRSITPAVSTGSSPVISPSGSIVSPDREPFVVGRLTGHISGGIYDWVPCRFDGSSWQPVSGSSAMRCEVLSGDETLSGMNVRVYRDSSRWYCNFSRQDATTSVPDDGLGCCSYLPETDLDGRVVAYDELSDSTYVIEGPFERRTGSVQLVIGHRVLADIGDPGDFTHVMTGAGPWYESGPICWEREWFRVQPADLGEPFLPARIEFFGRRTAVYAVVACTIWTPETWTAELDPHYMTTVPRTRLFLVANTGQQYEFWISLVDGSIFGNPNIDPADYFPTSALLTDCNENVPVDCDPLLGPNVADCFPTRTETDDGMGNVSATFRGVYCFNDPGFFDGVDSCFSLKGSSAWGIGEGGAIDSGLSVVSCDPLCFRPIGDHNPGQGGLPANSLIYALQNTGIPAEGTVIGGIDLPACPPDDGFCEVELYYESWCPPGGCPADGSSVFAEDLSTGTIYGPRPVQMAGSGEDCFFLAWSIRVRIETDTLGVPHDVPRFFRIHGIVGGDGEDDLATVPVFGCEPERVVVRYNPPVWPVQATFLGCPTDAPMVGINVTFKLYDDVAGDPGVVVASETVVTNGDGLAYFAFDRPLIGEKPIVRHLELSTTAEAPGYAETSQFFGPYTIAPVGPCEPVDLGTTVLPPDEDNVCTCGGLIKKCIDWDGNGSPVELHYDDGYWVGHETLSGRPTAGSACNPGGAWGESTPDILLGFAEDEGGNCVATAERSTPFCDPFTAAIPGCGGARPGLGQPLLARDDALFIDDSTTLSTDVLETWGPIGTFPGANFTDWHMPDSNPDYDDDCFAPPESFEDATAANCAGGVGMMMMMGVPSGPPPADGPPSPPTMRMVGSPARPARDASRPRPTRPRPTRTKRSAMEVFLDNRSHKHAAGSFRARACPERSNVGCGCNEIRCGFYGKKLPAHTCLGCTIKDRWVPPLVSLAPPARDPESTAPPARET